MTEQPEWREVKDKVGYTLNIAGDYTYIENRLTREEMRGIKKLIEHSLSTQRSQILKEINKSFVGFYDSFEENGDNAIDLESLEEWRQHTLTQDTLKDKTDGL